ncbi:MAG: DUF3089 domain-containing protein [Kiritimatiellae bacterium]|jgi:hypothetical protein|nr:DUF3089 domain-containing protein [Kiritimatiellia bacterium]
MTKKTLLITASLLLIISLTTPCIFASTAPDYSRSENWIEKADNINLKIDLFFAHPTTFSDKDGGNNAELTNTSLNEKTTFIVTNEFMPVFSKQCNIFAPRYRQMNIKVLSLPDNQSQENYAMAIADVESAFKYYIKNLNHGRPFIIAGHSQGSMTMLNVLKDNTQIWDKSKLVAAYLPGWTFTAKDLKALDLELCSSPEETGCLITWNTIGVNGTSPTLKENALCVNPLSWTSDTNNYPSSKNSFARIICKDNSILVITNLTSAQINQNGGLEIPAPAKEVADKIRMPMGPTCYHPYDYDFFFNNIKSNVTTRCSTFLR